MSEVIKERVSKRRGSTRITSGSLLAGGTLARIRYLNSIRGRGSTLGLLKKNLKEFKGLLRKFNTSKVLDMKINKYTPEEVERILKKGYKVKKGYTHVPTEYTQQATRAGRKAVKKDQFAKYVRSTRRRLKFGRALRIGGVVGGAGLLAYGLKARYGRRKEITSS